MRFERRGDVQCGRIFAIKYALVNCVELDLRARGLIDFSSSDRYQQRHAVAGGPRLLASSRCGISISVAPLRDPIMILGKLWYALKAQLNKVANFFWTADPIAAMQYEYDQSVAQLQEGRKGLEQYRALVERVTFQVQNDQRHVTSLESKVKAYLQAGDRETAAKFAFELQKAKEELSENQSQLAMHEQAYNNNVEKIRHATGKLAKIREKIQKYDAELKMSKAEAEIAQLAHSFNFDVSTDFGQIEQVIQDKIGLNRAKVRVAADLSSEGIVDIQREQAAEKVLADQALRQFEIDQGLATPETAGIAETQKELGPAIDKQTQTNG